MEACETPFKPDGFMKGCGGQNKACLFVCAGAGAYVRACVRTWLLPNTPYFARLMPHRFSPSSPCVFMPPSLLLNFRFHVYCFWVFCLLPVSVCLPCSDRPTSGAWPQVFLAKPLPSRTWAAPCVLLCTCVSVSAFRYYSRTKCWLFK